MLRHNTALEYLDLSDNGFDIQVSDYRYSKFFEGLLRNTTLRVVKVSNQANMFIDTLQTIFGQTPRSLDPSVAKTVGKVLALNCLQVLNFNYNRLGDGPIARYLAPGLQNNTSLQVLGLKRVGMGDAALIALSKALRNNTHLHLLDISFNADLTEAGYTELKSTLMTMAELHTLWFHTTRRRDDDSGAAQKSYATILSEALEENCTLTTMSHSDILTPQAKTYLDLNRHGRKWLCRDGGPQDVLWPIILSRMGHYCSVPVLAYFIRQNANFFASVSRHLPVPSSRKRRRM
jgi:hypothetical protein